MNNGEMESNAPNSDEDVPVKGIARSNTDIANEIRFKTVSSNRGKWYEPGIDICLYEDARNAVRDANTKFLDGGLKISAKDRDLLNIKTADWLSSPEGYKHVQRQIRELADQQQKKEDEASDAWKLTGDIADTFCDFAYKLSGMINVMVPQSPEYSIPYGALVVIFKAAVVKKKKKADLKEFLQKLLHLMPIVEFYQNEVPTDGMKSVIVAMYVQILDFVSRAVKYYTSGNVVRLVDAIFPKLEAQFEEYIKNIQYSMERMNVLKDVALKAQTSDIKETVEKSGQIIGELYENVKSLASSVAVLNHKLNEIHLSNIEWTMVQIIEHANNLRTALDSDEDDTSDEINWYQEKKFRLSPRDGWEENGILDEIRFWAKSDRNQLFWASGACGPNHDTWVTRFALDAIDAFRSQAAPLAYVLCDANEEMTPHLLCQKLISRILDQDPTAVLQDPRVFNARSFHVASLARSHDKLWVIIETLIMRLSSIFIVIDRIDRIFEGKEKQQVEATRFMMKLIDFVSEAPHNIRFIVTSIQEPSYHINDNDALQDVQDAHIDTRRRPGQKNNY